MTAPWSVLLEGFPCPSRLDLVNTSTAKTEDYANPRHCHCKEDEAEYLAHIECMQHPLSYRGMRLFYVARETMPSDLNGILLSRCQSVVKCFVIGKRFNKRARTIQVDVCVGKIGTFTIIESDCDDDGIFPRSFAVAKP